MLDAQDLQFFLVQPDTPEHQPVALQGFNGVNAHAAHHFLDLVLPGGQKVNQPLIADIGVQTLDQIFPLGSDTPVAFAGMAATHRWQPSAMSAAVPM